MFPSKVCSLPWGCTDGPKTSFWSFEASDESLLLLRSFHSFGVRALFRRVGAAFAEGPIFVGEGEGDGMGWGRSRGFENEK